MSGKYSRDKGARFERWLTHFLQDAGFAATKESRMYKPGADLSMPLLGIDRAIEAKKRATGFKQIYTWLIDRYAVVVAIDRQEPIVIMRLRDAIEIAHVAERIKT